MIIESGRERPLSIDFLCPTRHRDQQHLIAPSRSANSSRHFMPTKTRHPDIKKHRVRKERLGEFHRLSSVVNRTYFVARHVQQQGDAIGMVTIVVHYQNS
jgi:hypothetical protein